MTPTDILKNKEIRNAIARHCLMAERIFNERFGKRPHLKLNAHLLFEAIGSCYCSLYRLKVFRGIQQEDVHKRAAFLMKWISKYKPIQLLDSTAEYWKTDLQANEIFAIIIGLTVLQIPPQPFLDSQYATNLIYLLHFHSCHPEQLASELYLLQKQYPHVR
jgi:hypothetical protein